MQNVMLFLLANANVPFGRITSTARKGDKWFNQVTEGDEVTFAFTETGEKFGRAIVVKRELVTLAEVIRRAEENHAAEGAAEPRIELAEALRRAYGAMPLEEPFTMVHFIRLNTNTSPRGMVYAAIDSERDYQEALKDTAGTITDHELPAFLLFAEEYLSQAKRIASTDWSDDCNLKTLHQVRKVAALCVAAMELHGAPRRVMPEPEKLEARVQSIR